MNDYDVRAIFEEMELELIASMRRNLSRHQNWESKEKMNWTMWQVEQLKALEQFKKENEKIFSKKFTSVNNEIAKFLQENYQTAGIEQEKAILEHLAKGYTFNGISGKGLEGGFFTLNKDKMNALINAVTHDMEKAEHAMLRLVNDQYRKTIFRAEVMANSGAFTLKQSIDKATEDFLKAGINCIEYKNGRRVNIATYAEMAIRTANKGAVLVSEGDVRKAYGIHTVRISKYGACSETCLPWQGRIYVDDVYSGGTREEAEEKNLPLLSEAIAGGLFHPNCRHRATTYFYDVKKALGKLKDDGVEVPIEEQEHRKNHLHIQQQKRLEIGSLDPLNIQQAQTKKEQWIQKDRKLGYGDEWLPFKSSKTELVNNSKEIIDSYFKDLNIEQGSEEFENILREEFKIIPTKDLDILKTFNIGIVESQIESSYSLTEKQISINSTNYRPGVLAHELAHCATDKFDLYNIPKLKSIMENVLNSREGLLSHKIGGKEYIYINSSRFIRKYQGRTYITKEEFIKDRSLLKFDKMEEYVSVGYETFVSNPDLLYNKDIELYNFFKEGGLSNGKQK